MATKKKAAKPAAKQAEPRATKVTTVKAASGTHEGNPLRVGDSFLFIKGGREVYLTRTVANVLIKRNSDSLIIPKNSPYIPPTGSDCDGC